MSKSLGNNINQDVNPVATVWLLDSRTVRDEQVLPYLCWLSPDELQRYHRFLRPERQRQFLLGRILLRLALAELLDIAPTAMSLSERPGLAPELNLAGTRPGFSISHSGPWVACAVSAQSELGLDIEMLDGARDFLALAEQAFDVDACASLQEKTGEARVAAFYTLWSTKEASYKLAATVAANTTAEISADATSFAIEHCISFPHAAISIILCSALPLATTGVRTVAEL